MTPITNVNNIEYFDDILSRIHKLHDKYKGLDYIQPYIKIAEQILRPLRTHMIALDQVSDEEHEAYIQSLMRSDCSRCQSDDNNDETSANLNSTVLNEN